MPSHSKKKINYFKGLLAEYLAMCYYTLAGYRLLKHRHQSHFGEIDIIMAKGKMIVFIEVKYRHNRQYIAESISPRQQQRILRAAEGFLAAHRKFGHYRPRIDAFLVSGWRFRCFRGVV